MPCTPEEYGSVALQEGYNNRANLEILRERVRLLEDMLKSLNSRITTLEAK